MTVIGQTLVRVTLLVLFHIELHKYANISGFTVELCKKVLVYYRNSNRMMCCYMSRPC